MPNKLILNTKVLLTNNESLFSNFPKECLLVKDTGKLIISICQILNPTYPHQPKEGGKGALPPPHIIISEGPFPNPGVATRMGSPLFFRIHLFRDGSSHPSDWIVPLILSNLTSIHIRRKLFTTPPPISFKTLAFFLLRCLSNVGLGINIEHCLSELQRGHA